EKVEYEDDEREIDDVIEEHRSERIVANEREHAGAEMQQEEDNGQRRRAVAGEGSQGAPAQYPVGEQVDGDKHQHRVDKGLRRERLLHGDAGGMAEKRLYRVPVGRRLAAELAPVGEAAKRAFL